MYRARVRGSRAQRSTRFLPWSLCARLDLGTRLADGRRAGRARRRRQLWRSTRQERLPDPVVQVREQHAPVILRAERVVRLGDVRVVEAVPPELVGQYVAQLVPVVV